MSAQQRLWGSSNSSRPTWKWTVFPDIFLHCCNFLMRSFSVLITNHAAVVGEEIQVGGKSRFIYKYILQPSLWNDGVSSIISLSFSALVFPRKLADTRRNAPQAFSLVTLKYFIKHIVFEKFSNPRTHEILHLLIFVSLSRGNNFFSQIFESRSSPVRGFYEVSHQPEY